MGWGLEARAEVESRRCQRRTTLGLGGLVPEDYRGEVRGEVRVGDPSVEDVRPWAAGVENRGDGHRVPSAVSRRALDVVQHSTRHRCSRLPRSTCQGKPVRLGLLATQPGCRVPAILVPLPRGGPQRRRGGPQSHLMPTARSGPLGLNSSMGRNSAVAPFTLFQTALASPDRFALARPRPPYPHAAGIGPRRQRRAHPRAWAHHSAPSS